MCVKRVHNNDAFVNDLEINIYEKNIYTPHTNKEEVLSGFKTTACDVLSAI